MHEVFGIKFYADSELIKNTLRRDSKMYNKSKKAKKKVETKATETKKSEFEVEIGSRFTNRKTGKFIKILSFDKKTKKYTIKKADGTKVHWAKDYLKLAFLPGKVTIDVKANAEKKAKEKKAPKISKPSKRTFICNLLSKGGKLATITEKVNKEYPDSKGNEQYIQFCVNVLVDFGAGEVVKESFVPFEITVPE